MSPPHMQAGSEIEGKQLVSMFNPASALVSERLSGVGPEQKDVILEGYRQGLSSEHVPPSRLDDM